MKRNLLLSFLVASMLLTSALSLNSCKKNDTNANIDGVPTVETIVPLRDDFFFECPYCHDHILSGDMGHLHHFVPNGSSWIMLDADSVFMENRGCEIPENPNYCPYAAQHRFHRHHIYYILHGPDGGYHNLWHVGGGGTGE